MSGRINQLMTGSHLFERLTDFFSVARRRSRDREMLAMLSERDLRYAGLSRATIAFELNKPFWRG